MSIIKTRAKNFSNEEITSLVDLVLENKPKLFGAFSSKITSNEKDALWEEIARTISRTHGTIRSKDDVCKKWCNVLVKYKPIISDKISAAKKTGGGPAEAELTELEMKIKSIKGKETFEGIAGGVDISMMSSNSPLSDIEMVSSPAAVPFPFPVFSSQTASSDLAEHEMHPPRKRKLSDYHVADNVKKNILENEVQKVEILNAIDSKIEKFTEKISCKLDRIADSMDILISNQNRLIAMTANMPSGIQTNSLPPFRSSSAQIPHGYQEQYFPSIPPFYQQDKD